MTAPSGTESPTTSSSTLRVALDVRVQRYGIAGVARYASGVRATLEARADVEVVALGGGPVVPSRSLGRKLFTLRTDLAWFPLLARRAARRAAAAVYHTPLLRGPLHRGAPPALVTVQDLVPLRFPETMAGWNRAFTRATVRRLIDRADLLLATSSDTANDLQRMLGVPAERIRVVRIGIDERFFGPPPSRQVPEPYLLFVGTIEPRKNLSRLLEAHALLRRRGRRETLVIAGAVGWGDVRVGGEGVRVLGRVDDAAVHGLMAHAQCLVIPSLHEGFGLPAVEAMAAGTPVVASSAGALPEVCGGAAVLVDPHDPESIAEGIARAIDERATLQWLGRARAAHFRWRDVGEELVRVYRELA